VPDSATRFFLRCRDRRDGRALAPARLHFGWRIVRELIGFLERARELGAALSFDLALDAGVYAKVLPKLRGEDRPSVRKAFEAAEKVLADKGLERSRAKVKALREELEVTGSAHFWR